MEERDNASSSVREPLCDRADDEGTIVGRNEEEGAVAALLKVERYAVWRRWQGAQDAAARVRNECDLSGCFDPDYFGGRPGKELIQEERHQTLG